MSKLKGKSKMDKIMGDFELFSRNFIEISNSNGDRQKLTFNSAQKEIVEILEDNKYLILPKSRQAGCTTLFCSMAIHKAVTIPHQTIMIVSFSGESSTSIFNKLRDMNSHLPRKKYSGAFPDIKHENKNELSFTNGSRIISSVAGDKDLGRSMSLDMVLL